jgi:hypothetical protein
MLLVAFGAPPGARPNTKGDVEFAGFGVFFPEGIRAMGGFP